MNTGNSFIKLVSLELSACGEPQSYKSNISSGFFFNLAVEELNSICASSHLAHMHYL